MSLLSIGPMSHVDSKKCPCRRVGFRDQGPREGGDSVLRSASMPVSSPQPGSMCSLLKSRDNQSSSSPPPSPSQPPHTLPLTQTSLFPSRRMSCSPVLEQLVQKPSVGNQLLIFLKILPRVLIILSFVFLTSFLDVLPAKPGESARIKCFHF